MIDFTSQPMSHSTIVIQVNGKFEEPDRKYFFDCIRDFIDSGFKNVIIECHGLGYLNSSGLASLLAARKRVRSKGGRIFLTHLDSTLAEILEVTKLGRILSVFQTTEDAIESIENNLACDG